MRPVVTLRDAEELIKELELELHKLKTRDIDMNKRRIINASPSKTAYDYVVRAELEAFKETAAAPRERVINVTTIAKPDFDYAVFGIGINSTIIVGNDVTPRHIVMEPFSSGAHSAQLLKVYAQMKTPGGALEFRVWKNGGTQLFEMTVPSGDGSVITLDTFDNDALVDEDYLGVDILSMGGSPNGLYIKLKYVWN